MLRRFFTCLSTAALMTALPQSAPAQSEAPTQTTATYEDWTVRCRAVGEDKTEVCEMVQAVSVPNQQGVLANLAVGRLPGEDAVRMVIQFPLGVSLPAGVGLEIDETTLAEADYETCFPAFCIAPVDLDGDMIGKMEKSETLVLAFQDRAHRDIKLRTSLKGFAAAYKAISADMAEDTAEDASEE